MSLKSLLGLEAFTTLRDAEIMQKLKDARRENRPEVIFSLGKSRIVIKMSQVAPEGIMKEWQGYYEGK